MLRPTRDEESGDPPGPSLWSLVEAEVPHGEKAEVKRILGEAAVDLSLDLRAEMEVLLEVWRDIRCRHPSANHRPPSVLADPPGIKDLVTREIRMLLFSVRAEARHQGLDEEQTLSKYNPRVVSLVLGAEQPESRAGSRGTGRSRPPSGSREGDERLLASPSSGSSMEEELKDKLHVSQIDEVLLHLRSLLEAECQTLEKSIMILQQHLVDEHQYVAEEQMLQAEPSLRELKEERRILERDLQLRPSPTPSIPASKMVSHSKAPPARLLGSGGGGGAPCRSSPAVARPPDLQHEPSLSRPDPKLKSPEGRSVTGPGATSPLKGSQEAGLSAAPRSVHGTVECISGARSLPCFWGRGPVESLGVTSVRTAPSAPVTPVTTLRVPVPPKAQRPPGSFGPPPTFRRLRTLVMTLPP